MAEAILLVLWVGTALFFICREKKAEDDRKNREWQLSEVKECIHSIENEFRWRCQEIAEKEFSQYRKPLCNFDSALNRYTKAVRELKEIYTNDLQKKLVARMGKYRITSVPDDLEREYKRNISEIADTFCDFGDFMSEQIKKGGT